MILGTKTTNIFSLLYYLLKCQKAFKTNQILKITTEINTIMIRNKYSKVPVNNLFQNYSHSYICMTHGQN